jgi:putative lipoic acid-binding regulatory protein
MPQLLCQWHIQQNVLKAIKKVWADSPEEQQAREEDRQKFMTCYQSVIQAKSIDQYTELYEELKHKYTNHPDLLRYLKHELELYKEEIVEAWTCSALHFGNRVTSRIEGQHSMLKSYLQYSTGDLKLVVDKINTMIRNLINNFEARLAQAYDRRPHAIKFQALFSEELKQKVTPYGLCFILEQIALLDRADTPCEGLSSLYYPNP